MEAQAARLSLSRAEQLIERRKQYTISAIGDEDKRLRAQIEARYTAELSAVRRLLEVRKSAGEITARQYLDELRRFEAQLSKVRDANLGRVGGASSTAFKQVDAQVRPTRRFSSLVSSSTTRSRRNTASVRLSLPLPITCRFFWLSWGKSARRPRLAARR